MFSKVVAKFKTIFYLLPVQNESRMAGCVGCFEHVSSLWNCSVTAVLTANYYVTVNNTEGYWAVLLPCRYYSVKRSPPCDYRPSIKWK